MRMWADQIFYGLAAVVLGAALFVMSPAQTQDLVAFQSAIKTQVATATVQVFGDQPVFSDVEFVVSSINDFYTQSADAMIALLTPTTSDNDLNYVVAQVYSQFAGMFTTHLDQPRVAGVSTEIVEKTPANYMQEPALENILPVYALPTMPPTPPVLEKSVTAVNDNGQTWVDLRDASTGQVYCVAIFNAEVNRYIGPCKLDYR